MLLDLFNNQYDQETLKKHIYAISLINILKSQKIDVEFAVKYLLQPKYQLTKEETLITPKIVLYYQKHIKKEDLYKKIIDYDSEEDDIQFFIS